MAGRPDSSTLAVSTIKPADWLAGKNLGARFNILLLYDDRRGRDRSGRLFSKALLDVIPTNDTIGLVPCAISGEKIETFLKEGGTKYDWIVQRAKLAQQAGGVIEGILFHQGESNNGQPLGVA